MESPLNASYVVSGLLHTGPVLTDYLVCREEESTRATVTSTATMLR